MKAILKARGGFTKEISVRERPPVIYVAVPPVITWSEPEPSSVAVIKRGFYYKRSYIDAYDNEILVYQEM